MRLRHSFGRSTEVTVVLLLRTFGRWAENAGKCLTFGRCEEHVGDGNAATGVLGTVPHLRTFGRWAENAGKCLTFGRCGEHVGDGNAATGVLGTVPHLRTFGR